MTFKRPIQFALLSTLMMGVLSTFQAHAADTPRDRLIEIQAEASRQVANDEMQATLFAEFNEKDAATLSSKLNSTINQAMNTAKTYSQITVTTGNQNTYPIYNDKNQLTNWRGRAEINLNSQDFKATSDLIAKLQSNLQLQDIRFTVSKAQRQKVEDELYVEASKAFQKRAQLLVSPWNASGYELINLQLNTQGNYRPPMMMAADANFSLKSARVEAQNYEAGNSEVKVVATGTIQLK